jgi:hypothetical protein
MGFWFRDLLISQSAPAEISSARLACTRAQALQSPGRGSEVGTLKQSKRLVVLADPMIPTYSSGTFQAGTEHSRKMKPPTRK